MTELVPVNLAKWSLNLTRLNTRPSVRVISNMASMHERDNTWKQYTEYAEGAPVNAIDVKKIENSTLAVSEVWDRFSKEGLTSDNLMVGAFKLGEYLNSLARCKDKKYLDLSLEVFGNRSVVAEGLYLEYLAQMSFKIDEDKLNDWSLYKDLYKAVADYDQCTKVALANVNKHLVGYLLGGTDLTPVDAETIAMYLAPLYLMTEDTLAYNKGESIFQLRSRQVSEDFKLNLRVFDVHQVRDFDLEYPTYNLTGLLNYLITLDKDKFEQILTKQFKKSDDSTTAERLLIKAFDSLALKRYRGMSI